MGGTRNRYKGVLGCVSAIVVAACGGEPSHAARCRALGDALRSTTIEVRTGSRLDATGTLEAGRTPTCDEDPRATALYVTAHDLLPAIPAALRPARVVIHHDPALSLGARPIAALEAHRPSESLLAAGGPVPRAVWLHELAHVRMFGARPATPVARRLFDAIEEGIADYAAAAIGGSARLPGRPLDRPMRLVADDWATLAFDTFDPHRLGWSLAASFWIAEPRPGELLEDLVGCMTSASSFPERTSDAVETWLRGCPARSRDRVADRVCHWLPRELASPISSCKTRSPSP